MIMQEVIDNLRENVEEYSEMDDDELLEKILICDCCGEDKYSEEDVETSLGIAHNGLQFIQICEALTDARWDENSLLTITKEN